LAVRRLTLGNSFQEFVDEHPITPTTIVVEQSQGADRLVESGQVTGIQQEALSSNKGFASNLKGARLSGIGRVSGARVLAKRHEHFVLYNVPAVCSTDGLLSSALT